MRNGANLQLVHSTPVSALKTINQHDAASIADRCLIFEASRWTVAREYGVSVRDINHICDEAMFHRGFAAGRAAGRLLNPILKAA